MFEEGRDDEPSAQKFEALAIGVKPAVLKLVARTFAAKMFCPWMKREVMTGKEWCAFALLGDRESKAQPSQDGKQGWSFMDAAFLLLNGPDADVEHLQQWLLIKRWGSSNRCLKVRIGFHLWDLDEMAEEAKRTTKLVFSINPFCKFGSK